MNSMFKKMIMVTLLLSAGSVMCNAPEDQLFDAFAAQTKPAIVSAEDKLFDAFATGKLSENNQSYWSQMTQALAQAAHSAKTMSVQAAGYVREHTPNFVAQTCAYLAEMPQSVDGTYLTADNAKNVLAKAGAAAVVAAAIYGVYKVTLGKTKKEVDCGPIRFV